MPVAERFFDALLRNIVFLICLLPLVGAVLSLLSARLGAAHVRSTALTNTLLTLALSTLMAANYRLPKEAGRTPPNDVQMVSAFRWIGPTETRDTETAARGSGRAVRLLGRIDVRFAVGVDGLSLWPIVLTSLLTFSAVAASRSDDYRKQAVFYGAAETAAPQFPQRSDNYRQPAAFYALLLAAQSALICLFAALDVVLFCVCLSLSLVPVFFLIGTWGGYERRAAARSFLLHNLGGSLLVTLGLAAFVLLSQADLRPPLTFTLTHLSGQMPQLTAMLRTSDWSLLAGSMLWLLTLGLAVRLAAVPCHVWFVPAVLQAPLPVRVLLCGLFPLTGLYGLARFAAPLLAGLDASVTALLQGIAVGGAIYCGLLAAAQRDLRRLACCTCLSAVHLGAAGVLTRTPAGTMGGFLLVMGAALAACAVLLQVDRRQREASLQPFSAGRGFCAAALLGLPGTAGFAGGLLTLLGLFEANRLAAAGGLLAWLFVACAIVVMLSSGAANAASAATVRSQSAVPRGGRAVLVLILAVIVAVGLSPRLVTDRMQASVSRLLEASGTDVGNPGR
jgi:NADH:ubiquinone oxidoreductase subunit 4 (subunit M)